MAHTRYFFLSVLRSVTNTFFIMFEMEIFQALIFGPPTILHGVKISIITKNQSTRRTRISTSKSVVTAGGDSCGRSNISMIHHKSLLQQQQKKPLCHHHPITDQGCISSAMTPSYTRIAATTALKASPMMTPALTKTVWSIINMSNHNTSRTHITTRHDCTCRLGPQRMPQKAAVATRSKKATPTTREAPNFVVEVAAATATKTRLSKQVSTTRPQSVMTFGMLYRSIPMTKTMYIIPWISFVSLHRIA